MQHVSKENLQGVTIRNTITKLEYFRNDYMFQKQLAIKFTSKFLQNIS